MSQVQVIHSSHKLMWNAFFNETRCAFCKSEGQFLYLPCEKQIKASSSPSYSSPTIGCQGNGIC